MSRKINKKDFRAGLYFEDNKGSICEILDVVDDECTYKWSHWGPKHKTSTYTIEGFLDESDGVDYGPYLICEWMETPLYKKLNNL